MFLNSTRGCSIICQIIEVIFHRSIILRYTTERNYSEIRGAEDVVEVIIRRQSLEQHYVFTASETWPRQAEHSRAGEEVFIDK